MLSWERSRLRKAAARYAAHGWPVRLGAFPVGRHSGRRPRRFDCATPGCPTVAVEALMLDAIGVGPVATAGRRATWRTAV
ncbi:hypothetical protein [Dactylosporangium sp. NPDC048998]|uniref:hypothetical protein n=1 Tax=Dactylosporangium sp. NPDC048998 TaxID=3363976 RepID=UPI0037240DF2